MLKTLANHSLALFLLFLCAKDLSSAPAQLIASKEAGWPQFRGPRRDGISEERGLLRSWPAGGPKLLWTATNLGHGYSSPIISNNRIVLSGDVGTELHLFALDLSGKPLWTATNGAAWTEQFPGARSSAAFSSGRVYHQNAHANLVCLEAATGKKIWSIDLLKKYNGENITWGLSECALVDDRAVYAIAGGGKAFAVALDKITGEAIWTTPPLPSADDAKKFETASYVSPILVQFAERRLLIGCSLRQLFCIDAANGQLQWTRPMPTTYSVLALTPALVDDAIFMTAPHGKGGALFRLLPGAKFGVEEIWRTPLDTCQGGVIYRDGKLVGSFYPGRKGWAAIDGKTGSLLYTQPDYVKGAAIYADNRLYALSEDGWMRLLESANSEFKTHGQFRLATATTNDAWAHPVILNRRLYLRFHETLYCYDIAQN